jgi:glycosyltransferase involved in cell wall biosynthesis
MPNILLETMAAGLPIAASNMGPMPEVLGDAGVYFDPTKPTEIATAIETLLNDPELRIMNATNSYERVQQFSWQRCAEETFAFLARIAQQQSIQKYG